MTMTLHRDGAFTVELVRELGPNIKSVTVKPVSADVMIRWEDELIPSFYALLAELTGVPESVLLQLSGIDLERVMFAFTTLLTTKIAEELGRRQRNEADARPMSTLYERADQPFYSQAEAPLPDIPARDPEVEPLAPYHGDMRYPDIGGEPVRRPPNEPPNTPRAQAKRHQQQANDGGMRIETPSIMEKVG